jgi:SAM-dependent methyltransferase
LDLEALSRLDLPLGTLLEVAHPGGDIPFDELFALGVPVVDGRGAVTGPWPWDRERLVLRVAAVGRRAYRPTPRPGAASAAELSGLLTQALTHLERAPEDAAAWRDATWVARRLGAVNEAASFEAQARELDPDAAEADLGPAGAPATSRARLEGWLRRHAPSMVGPVLDVGTSRSQRGWIHAQAMRLTLDSSEAVFDAATEAPDVRGDVEDLSDLPEGIVGSIVCTEVLEHVRRPEAAARSLLRITRPGGRLYASVPWIYPYHPTPLDLRRFTQQGLGLLLEDAGWTIEALGGIRMSPAAHRAIVEAVASFRGGGCPAPESMAYTNWTVVARRTA